MKLYLAGPMTGIPDFNYPTFHATAARLREAGYTVLSPTENGLDRHAPWEQHMRADLPMLMQCHGLALMDGWQHSKGVHVERQAALGVGIWVMPWKAWIGVARAVREAVNDLAADGQHEPLGMADTESAPARNYAGLARSVTSFLRGGA